MAISMTGYGRGETSDAERRAAVEIRSINNRYCDIQVRMPRALAALENRVREEIGRQIARGKLEVQINFEDIRPDAYRVTCDVGLARAYAGALRQIAESAGVADGLNAGLLGRFSDVLHAEPAQVDPETAWQFIRPALLAALDDLGAMRRLEGDRLAGDILHKLEVLEKSRTEIAERAPRVLVEYRQRLQDRVRDLIGDQATLYFDEQRLAAEIALFADKCSIDEELVRLGSHLRQVQDVIGADEPSGKKLDFLVQELNREINTIGSKANDLEITNQVISMKTELEKIREQIQNLE
jgi:uncharacterized protein (TIGR00255 family)